MFGLGMGELIVIVVVALLFLGPEKLPGAAKAIGKGIRDLKRQTRDLQDTLEQDDELGDAVRDLKYALRGEDAPPRRPQPVPPGGVPDTPAPSDTGQQHAPAVAPAEGAVPRGAPASAAAAAAPASSAEPTGSDDDDSPDTSAHG